MKLNPFAGWTQKWRAVHYVYRIPVILFLLGLVGAILPPPEDTVLNEERPAESSVEVEQEIPKHKQLKLGADVTEFDIQKIGDQHRLWIVIKYDALWNDKELVDKAAIDAMDFIEAEQKAHRDDPVGNIMLNFYIPSVDRYGNSGESYAFRLIYSAEDVARMNTRNLTFMGVLDLAQLENVKPIARQGLQDWCDKHRRDAPNFCFTALN